MLTVLSYSKFSLNIRNIAESITAYTKPSKDLHIILFRINNGVY